jgi:hypothetical protein
VILKKAVIKAIAGNDYIIPFEEGSAAHICVEEGWLYSVEELNHLSQRNGNVILTFPSGVHRK